MSYCMATSDPGSVDLAEQVLCLLCNLLCWSTDMAAMALYWIMWDAKPLIAGAGALHTSGALGVHVQSLDWGCPAVSAANY